MSYAVRSGLSSIYVVGARVNLCVWWECGVRVWCCAWFSILSEHERRAIAERLGFDAFPMIVSCH